MTPQQVSEAFCFVQRDQGPVTCVGSVRDAVAGLAENAHRTWINLLAPDREHLAHLVATLGFHELAVEDLFSPRSRAKVEEYPGHLFCVFPALNLNPGADPLDIINFNAFLGKNYLISAQLAPLPAVGDVRAELEQGRLGLSEGADFLLYRLLDALVDEYLAVSDEISEQIEALEERLFVRFDPALSAEIFKLKRRVTWLRRRSGPQRDILNCLVHRPHELVGKKTQVYLRDVHDHVFRVSANLDTFHELLQGAFDAHLTRLSHRTNEVMKLLSIVATIVLPLNVLTGLYGTNFSVLPGRDHPWAFWFFCAVLLCVVLLGVLLIRIRRWL